MQYIPENLTKKTPPSLHEVAHERRQLKWFMVICLLLLLLTFGTNGILGLYGKSSIPPQDDPMVQPTPTIQPPTPSPLPTMAVSPTSSTKSSGIKPSPSPTAIPTKAAPKTGDQTMCPMDAKVCPDGKTYVGRTGPNCEFAACPK